MIHVSESEKNEGYCTDVDTIVKFIGHKMVDKDAFKNAKSYSVKDLFTGEITTSEDGVFKVPSLKACANVTLRIAVND
jgi:alpha-galactosidase